MNLRDILRGAAHSQEFQNTVQGLLNQAQERLNIPSEPSVERSATLSGMKKGAAITGVLALLLGTQTGRKVTGTGIKVGSLALLGTMAYQALQNWQKQSNAPHASASLDKAIHEIDDPETLAQRSEILLHAVVMAAKADGQIDAKENAILQQLSAQLSEEQQQGLQEILNAPVDAARIARLVGNNPVLANEVYLASRSVVDEVSPAEERYLQALAQALNLSADMVAHLNVNNLS